MRKLLITLVLTVLFLPLLWLMPAQAADLGAGEAIFKANCAACHMGGGNVVNGAKTLKQGDLEKWDMASVAAIKNQVINGKGAMPGFGSKFNAEQIENVASYVLDQASKGW